MNRSVHGLPPAGFSPAVVLAATLLVGPPSLDAQVHSALAQADAAPRLAVEVFRPFIQTGEGVRVGWNSGGAILFLSGSIGSRAMVAAELPLAWGSQVHSLPDYRARSDVRGVGNPGVFLRRILAGERDSGVTALDATLRLPLAWSSGGSMDPLFLGVLADPTRVDRWAHDLTALSAGALRAAPVGGSAEFYGRGGIALWLISGESSHRELVAEYEAGIRTRGSGVRGGVELRGIAALGSDYRGLSDRTLHRLHGEVGAPVGRWRLTGFARANLDSAPAEMARFTAGARAEMPRGVR